MERQIFTGNIIKAFEKYPKGKLVNFTDHEGQVRQGLVMPKEFDIREELDKEPVAFKQGHQVKAFLTDLTSRRGAVKTLDELLILKAQINGEGFILQSPKSKESGAKYFLDEALIAAVGNDFHSVADRMEVVVPPERLEQTLTVLMTQHQYTLAAFDHKEIAREYLGVQLPKLEAIDTAAPTPPPVREPLPLPPPPIPTASPQPTPSSTGILPPKQQQGQIAKRVARFLEKAGLLEAVTAGEDFHLKIENEPYIPLVVERQLDELYLTHYLEQNGDTFIDTEMVLKIQPNGQLQFKEVATQNAVQGGELRSPDRVFANAFARNIHHQGFAGAARDQLPTQSAESPEVKVTEPNSLKPDLQAYLDVKARYPEALPLLKTTDGRFYETFLEDARALSEKTEVILTSTDSGSPDLGRVPVTGFPVHAVNRYLDLLQQSTTIVIVDGADQVQVHPQIGPTVVSESPPITEATAEAQPTLFSLETFESTTPAPRFSTTVDPSWNHAEQPPSPSATPVPEAQPPPAVETPSATSPITRPQPSIEDLREWYRHARDIGRSEKHLKQIEMISRGAIAGKELSDRDFQALDRDEGVWKQQINTVTVQARYILDTVGTQDAAGQHFSGKTYSIHGSEQGLAIAAAGRGDLLHLQNDQVILSKVTHVDAQRFQKFAELIQSRSLNVQSPQPQLQSATLEP